MAEADLDNNGGVESAISRPVSHAEVVYLQNKFAFVQIINSSATFQSEKVMLHFIASRSGWKIFDYGDAICSSPGQFMYGGEDHISFLKQFLLSSAVPPEKPEDKDTSSGGSGEGGAVISGSGTIVMQTVTTVEDIIDLVLKKNWQGITLINGTPLMKWAMWVLAAEKEIALKGFQPTREDEDRAKRRRRFVEQAERLSAKPRAF